VAKLAPGARVTKFRPWPGPWRGRWYNGLVLLDGKLEEFGALFYVAPFGKAVALTLTWSVAGALWWPLWALAAWELIDALWWLRGYVWNRPRSDGGKLRIMQLPTPRPATMTIEGRVTRRDPEDPAIILEAVVDSVLVTDSRTNHRPRAPASGARAVVGDMAAAYERLLDAYDVLAWMYVADHEEAPSAMDCICDPKDPEDVCPRCRLERAGVLDRVKWP